LELGTYRQPTGLLGLVEPEPLYLCTMCFKKLRIINFIIIIIIVISTYIISISLLSLLSFFHYHYHHCLPFIDAVPMKKSVVSAKSNLSLPDPLKKNRQGIAKAAGGRSR
jgi:hypothetical protein